MRTALLTTSTVHHDYFAWSVAGLQPWSGSLVETESLAAPFEVAHQYEELRESYERDLWLRDARPPAFLEDNAKKVPTVNCPEAVSYLLNLQPDVVIVFGTGKLKAELLSSVQAVFLNLHGGDPQQYRGLDSHLWAVYHKDFGALVTSLHHVNERLDDGDIVDLRPVEISPGMPLYALRAANTEICVAIVRDVLRLMLEGCSVKRVPQKQRGRYYSYMPSALKEICVRNFTRHTETL